jgi:hypothetical protein
MTLRVTQSASRDKKRTSVTGTDPVQVVLMVIAAFAIVTRTAPDVFFLDAVVRKSV